MSLINILKKKSKVETFTTPSHSQKFFIFSKLRQFYKFDISETDVHNPQAALNLAQKKASDIYKTKSTHFLTNGSSSGIIAAVLACVKRGEKILIWDKAHPSHRNAATLSGAVPVFYELEKDEDWGIYRETDPKTIENILKKEKIKAVIITSPSYEGVVSDVAKIKEICSKHGAYLIVDEAHGALYPFCDKLPKSAIYQGADFTIQSLHKTAGGLNPTALLHCNLEKIDVESALKLISTTSPSYPLLASIEKNINFLKSSPGKKKVSELIKNIENMKKNLQNLTACEFYDKNAAKLPPALEGEGWGGGYDPTKILVKIKNLSGLELSEILFDKFKIEDEITNEKSVMLLTGIGTDFKKLKKLEHALKKLSEK